VRMARKLGASTASFQEAGRMAVAGLTAGLLMWLIAFLSVGGEWFLMWQSPTWNGQGAAFRMFTVTGIVLLLLALPEYEPAA
jgi:predicted small integral membrane protein